jgi:DNA repair exonuclease SbcCD ATPase subunit
MIIQSISIRNFRSISDISLKFEETGLVLVDGFNHDRNTHIGAGKSSIFDAMCFCIYNKLPKKIKVSNLLKSDEKECVINVAIKVKSDIWEIRRSRPVLVEYFKNGNKEIISQEEFENIIGVDYEKFLSVCYNSQNNQTRFLDKNDSQKKEFILDIMGFSVFLEKRKEVSHKINEIDSNIVQLRNSITDRGARSESYKEILTSFSFTDSEYEDAVKELKLRISRYKSMDKPEKPDFSDLNKEETRLEERMDEIKESVYRARGQEKELEVLKDRYESLTLKEVKIEDEIECPHCSESFGLSHNGTFTVDDLKKKHIAKLEKLKSDIDDFSLLEINVDKNEVKKIKERRLQIADEKEAVVEKYNEEVQRVNDIATKIKLRKKEVDSMREDLEKRKKYKSQIEKLNKEKEKLCKELEVLEKDFLVHREISSILSPSGVSGYILEGFVESLNLKIKEMMDTIWPEASYKILTSKSNSNKDVVSKFSESLIIDNNKMSIDMLSGGEYKTVSFIVDIAIMLILSEMFSKKVNQIILDEPFFGFDSESKEKIMNLLMMLRQSRMILVIDHSSEFKAAFDETILIEKRNGSSYISE